MTLLIRNLLILSSFVGTANAEIIGFIEKVFPSNAGAKGNVLIKRNSAELKALEGDELQRFDRVIVKGRSTTVYLVIGGRSVTVGYKEASKDGYLVDISQASMADNLSSFILSLFNVSKENEIMISAATRTDKSCENNDLSIPAYAVSALSTRLVTGNRALFIPWKGGFAPFNVAVYSDNVKLIEKNVKKNRRVIIPAYSWKAGTYSLVVKDKCFNSANAESLTGWVDDDLTFVDPNDIPPVPTFLKVADMPDTRRRYLHARWLARQDGGMWTLEAIQIAARLANVFNQNIDGYAPAIRWLEKMKR